MGRERIIGLLTMVGIVLFLVAWAGFGFSVYTMHTPENDNVAGFIGILFWGVFLLLFGSCFSVINMLLPESEQRYG